jgi:hypothetical protein
MVLQFLWESRTLPGLIIFLVNTDIFVRVGADGQAYGLLFTGTPFGRSLLSTSCFDPATLAETSSASE